MSAGCLLPSASVPAPRWLAYVRRSRIQPSAIEVWQIFAVGRAAREDTFARELSVQATQHFGSQLGVNGSLLKTLTQPGEICAAVRRIVNELFIVQHRVDGV